MIRPDSTLGIYRLIERLGSGGMGEVWKAEDTRLGRIVAIKILPPAIAADLEATARIRREARTIAQLNHPNIATIHAFEESAGLSYIVMELVAGEPLSKVIAGGRLPEAEVRRIARGVAEALAEAHAKGIVHRDIKPDNIIVSDSRVKVLDFGIAKQLVPAAGSDDPTAVLTQQGMIIGTINYMSPEQALGKPIDARSDIFSLGIVMYQAATGRLPFAGESVTDTMTRIIRDEPAPPTGLSPGLTQIIQRCLRKNRDDRYATASEFASALDVTAPATRPVAAPTAVEAAARRRTPRWIPVAGMLAVVIGILVALGVFRKEERPPASGTVGTPLSVPAPPAVSETTLTVIEVPPAPTQSAGEETRAAQIPAEPTADDYHRQGIEHLRNRDLGEARVAFERAVGLDPRHGFASLRLGQMALLARQGTSARSHFLRALESRKLDDRDQFLARLGLAIANGNRAGARALAAEARTRYADDVEIQRFADLVEGDRRPGPRRRR